ncbi:hypothetical protein BJ508DRAFT_334775 [Ascobolus immersus RN42]|uniref:Uncharacterized protein n=1 Tax=Ascobolus immersus RN42 TaxID=1160509 RepID=A0A3N4HIB8_ASCIM|nr:hypothetical protein BJ508DRAFT_334775 [Ascobolus immersus RN42]
MPASSKPVDKAPRQSRKSSLSTGAPDFARHTQASRSRDVSPSKLETTKPMASPEITTEEEETTSTLPEKPPLFTHPMADDDTFKQILARMAESAAVAAIEQFIHRNPVAEIVQKTLAPIQETLTKIEGEVKQNNHDHLELLSALAHSDSQSRVKDLASKKLGSPTPEKPRSRLDDGGHLPPFNFDNSKFMSTVPQNISDDARFTMFGAYREPEKNTCSTDTTPSKTARTSYGNPAFALPTRPSQPRKPRFDFDNTSTLSPLLENHHENPLEKLSSVHISKEGKDYYDTVESLNRFTRKSTLKPSDIGSFDGSPENLYPFLKEIEDTVQTSGVDARDIVLMIPRCLSGVAASWYAGLEREDKKFMLASVDNFMAALKEEYPAQTRAQKKDAVAYAYDPDVHADIREYYYKKIEMMRSAEPGISEEDLIMEIYLGLEDKAPGIAASVTVTTFTELSEFKTELFFKAESYRHMIAFRRAGKKKEKGRSDSKRSTKAKRSSSTSKGYQKGKEEKKPFERKKRVVRPSELPQGRPCRHCGSDHFDDECSSKGTEEKDKKERKKDDKKGDGKRKVYWFSEGRGKKSDTSSDEESESSEQSVSDSESSSSEDEKYMFFPRSYQSSYFSQSPFVGSRTVSTKDVNISILPRRDTVGSGLDYMTAHPLPVEIFLSRENQELDEMPSSVRSCVDSGGQCLISRPLLEKRFPGIDTTQHTAETQPTFSGIGGGKDKPDHYVVMEVYFPNQAALLGEGSGRRITRITMEFQIVENLDCNVLIGREALKGHGIRIIEDEELIAFPDGNTAPIINATPAIQRPPPKKLYSLKGRYVLPGQEISLEIRNPGLHEASCLIASPVLIDRRDRYMGGMIPRCTIRGNQAFVRFRNLSKHPIRIQKGEPIATVELLDPEAVCAKVSDGEERD